ncbi:CHAT domain-containing protein [Salinispora arenicola]|uniref:CHAT domain-containing protein n=1 Tax=Salinispora arenicola TaxID=168697 RepID=UPI0003A25C26|nr:CHAT domain-containing protein [Salinispora arenicola]
MADTASASEDPSAHLARARRAVTAAVTAAWLAQARAGEAIGEHVRDLIITLVTERSPRAKFQMISEHPQLQGDAAERLLDRAVEFCRGVPDPNPSYVRFFQSHLDMIRLVRSGQVAAEAVPIEPLADAIRQEVLANSAARGSGSASEHDRRARELRDRGQIEEARFAFGEAVRQARAAGDAATEGRAEIGLFTLLMKSSHPQRGSHQQMLEHARRAADAYQRAGDRSGERDAVVAMITVLTDIADKVDLPRTLQRLSSLDENYGRWWRAYSTAMNAVAIRERTDGLRWCIESANLLGDQADFYRKMCEGKLAFYENRSVSVDDDGTGVFEAGITAYEVMVSGPTEIAARRLDNILREVERKRRYARSQTLQRELSGANEIVYLTAAMCAEALRSVEEAVDVNELGSSRALLAQIGMHNLWRQWHLQVWEDSRSEKLQRLLAGYATSPTESKHQRLLQAFGDQRHAQRRQEHRLLAATPGLSTITPPASVRSVQALLAQDHRIVVYGATGSIYLISHDECRIIGKLPRTEIAETVQRGLAHLSDPTNLDRGGQDAIDWITDKAVQPLLAEVPEGSRVFVLPHGPLWQIPLGVLGPTKLAEICEVSYMPSLTLLSRLLTRRRLMRNIERFVGFGDPDGSLPHARAEIELAASTFIDSFTMFGDSLHYHMVMANLADADVAHVGCHGMFFPDYPDFSALHIAGNSDAPEFLWYGELARYEFNARLVVLAACHAGTGVTLFGSEYVGFPGAFLAAGAQGVLAPLWAVSDEATAALMRYFYQALSTSASPAEALRTSQQAMIADPATSHPYHWAGFQLFGTAPRYRPLGET